MPHTLGIIGGGNMGGAIVRGAISRNVLAPDQILVAEIDPERRDAAAKLGCTPELCQVGMDILTWQKLRQRLPFLLPMDTKVGHKTGTGVRNYNDAGVIFEGDDPRFILAALTDRVPKALPNGLPGNGAASFHIAQLSRTAWDVLVGN
jgi:beta-lactamase class A